MIWSELTSVIADNRSFLISSHTSIDGDCAGSELAMLWHLKSLGKNVTVYNHDALPPKFAFLKNAGELTDIRPQGPFDALMVLDCSNTQRLGWEGAENIARTIINIDHHRDNINFGNVNIVRSTASATGQIIYDYLSHVKADIPAEVADALYTAILTDTGGFRFSNTNGSVLAVCSDLCERGADCSGIYEKVYASFSPNGLMLQSRIWSTLAFHNNGTICTMEMPYSLIDELGATGGDSEGMSDFTIMATGVEIGMLIKYGPEQTHFSLRSNGRVDVGKIAKKIEGGGGHGSAAGCTMSLPFAQAKPLMLEILSRELG
jgi:phosphoesterase RecJ-like protein